MRAPAEPAARELNPMGEGRSFRAERVVRLGEVGADGALRLDAIARHLQDVATDDARDAGLDRRFGWLVRRTLIDVRRAPRLGEPIELTTWCAGTGASWAERRTSIRGRRGGHVETVSLWVQIALATGAPARLARDFLDVYGPAAGGRRVGGRLVLDAPADHERGGRARPWVVRRTDLDPYGHVNNAATWAVVEEAFDLGDRSGVAELEYPAPIDVGVDVSLLGPVPERDGGDPVGERARAWVVRVDDGTVLAAARWSPRAGPGRDVGEAGGQRSDVSGG